MFRKLLIAPLALGLVLATGAAAFGGGWAVTEFDQPLPEFVTGEEYVVGFTVLQHGVTPRWTEEAGLSFTPRAGGDPTVFPGKRSGDVGHFQAVVVLPGGGTWDLEVDQGILSGTDLHFAPHVVGPVDVTFPGKVLEATTPAPPPATPKVDASPTTPVSSTGSGPALAAIVAVVFGGAAVVWLARWRRTINPGTVYKKAQSSSEAAWTTEN